VAWQKQAENCANYLKKGRLVAVEGRLQIRNYETQDGQKRKAAEVVASFVEFLSKAPESKPTEGNHADNQTPDYEGVNLEDLPS
jgi:single-strand DNA-binding protein